jgi:predicted HicB family RNase H-like nuclease
VTTNKKRATYRLTPELDRILAKEAEQLGVSKNAIVQITLSKAFEQKSAQAPTGTDG